MVFVNINQFTFACVTVVRGSQLNELTILFNRKRLLDQTFQREMEKSEVESPIKRE